VFPFLHGCICTIFPDRKEKLICPSENWILRHPSEPSCGALPNRLDVLRNCMPCLQMPVYQSVMASLCLSWRQAVQISRRRSVTLVVPSTYMMHHYHYLNWSISQKKNGPVLKERERQTMSSCKSISVLSFPCLSQVKFASVGKRWFQSWTPLPGTENYDRPYKFIILSQSVSEVL